MTIRTVYTVRLRTIVAIVAVVALLWLTAQLRQLFFVTVAAVLLTTGLARVTERLERAGLPSLAAALLPFVGLVGAFALLVTYTGAALFSEVQTLAREVTSARDAVLGVPAELSRLFPPLRPLEPLLDAAAQNVAGEMERLILRPDAVSVTSPTGATALAGVIGPIALAFLNGVVTLLFVLVITLYLLIDRERVRRYALSLVPATRRDHVAAIADRAARRTGGWIMGQATICGLVGALTFAALSVIGVRVPLLLAVVTAVAELIPLIGPFSAGALAVLVASTQTAWQAALTLLFYVVFQQVDGYFLGPRIVGAAVRIHPLVVLLSIGAGAELFGFAGALLGPPLAAALAVLIDEWRERGTDQ